MRAKAADLAGRLFRVTGLDDVALRWRAPHFCVLMYHGVTSPDPDYYNWCQVPEDRFARQLEYLAKRYRFVDEEQVVGHLVRGAPLPPRAAFLSFDDGYVTNYTRAFPILQRLGIPATIFLTSALIGTDRVPWPERVFLLIQESGAPRLDLRDWGLDVYDLSGPDGRDRGNVDAVTLLKSLRPAGRDERMAALAERLGAPVRRSPARDDLALMTWDQARAMQDSGLVSFGGHTRRHEILQRLDDAELEREVLGCCEELQRNLGRRPRLFAYPNGRFEDFDDRAKALLREAGIVAAFSTVGGFNGRDADPLALRRLGIGADMPFGKFVLKCSGVTAARTGGA